MERFGHFHKTRTGFRMCQDGVRAKETKADFAEHIFSFFIEYLNIICLISFFVKVRSCIFKKKMVVIRIILQLSVLSHDNMNFT